MSEAQATGSIVDGSGGVGETGKGRKGKRKAKEQSKDERKTIALPDDKDSLDEIFRMLREDDALFNQTLGTVIEAAALFAALDAIVVAIGLASLASPVPTHSMLQHLQELGFPGSAMLAQQHRSALVLALVGEFLLLLVTSGYFTWYPIVRVLRSQRQYFAQGIAYLLATDVKVKQEMLREGMNRRIPHFTIVFLVIAVGLPFLLLVLGALTSLYSVLLHIPFGT